MKTIIINILILLTGIEVFATSQIPDKLLIKGIEYDLFSNPLEIYFEKNPNKRPKHIFNGLIITSSALWRGYVATFEIEDRKLIVKDIQILCIDTTNPKSNHECWLSVIKEVFPDQKRIEVDWFSGLLVLPIGKLVDKVNMGYGSTYENYILLEIDAGNLKVEKYYNFSEYDEFRELQFQAFKKTSEYKRIKKSLSKEGNSKLFIDSFLRIYITDYTSKILIE